ncbi:hypothetical protein B0H17DRAFT_1124850 [Mycena rosella]|uniref:Uncharacterized protein n=1 Tax=Mycena rosella TaxID=1033263 RepID=A0AAD7MAK7_MYCRO|nr:hypothetical protein B0H17DRAFT_1124850 [Mycena rosella]
MALLIHSLTRTKPVSDVLGCQFGVVEQNIEMCKRNWTSSMLPASTESSLSVFEEARMIFDLNESICLEASKGSEMALAWKKEEHKPWQKVDHFRLINGDKSAHEKAGFAFYLSEPKDRFGLSQQRGTCAACIDRTASGPNAVSAIGQLCAESTTKIGCRRPAADRVLINSDYAHLGVQRDVVVEGMPNSSKYRSDQYFIDKKLKQTGRWGKLRLIDYQTGRLLLAADDDFENTWRFIGGGEYIPEAASGRQGEGVGRLRTEDEGGVRNTATAGANLGSGGGGEAGVGAPPSGAAAGRGGRASGAGGGGHPAGSRNQSIITPIGALHLPVCSPARSKSKRLNTPNSIAHDLIGLISTYSSHTSFAQMSQFGSDSGDAPTRQARALATSYFRLAAYMRPLILVRTLAVD